MLKDIVNKLEAEIAVLRSNPGLGAFNFGALNAILNELRGMLLAEVAPKPGRHEKNAAE